MKITRVVFNNLFAQFVGNWPFYSNGDTAFELHPILKDVRNQQVNVIADLLIGLGGVDALPATFDIEAGTEEFTELGLDGMACETPVPWFRLVSSSPIGYPITVYGFYLVNPDANTNGYYELFPEPITFTKIDQVYLLPQVVMRWPVSMIR